jgi:hypothetical protein
METGRSEPFFRGWDITHKVNGEEITESICIGELPMRKRLALYHMKPGMFTSLAFFTTEEDAREAARLIELLTISTLRKEA